MHESDEGRGKQKWRNDMFEYFEAKRMIERERGGAREGQGKREEK